MIGPPADNRYPSVPVGYACSPTCAIPSPAPRCGKTTWDGCGEHVAEVKHRCRLSSGAPAAKRPPEPSWPAIVPIGRGSDPSIQWIDHSFNSSTGRVTRGDDVPARFRATALRDQGEPVQGARPSRTDPDPGDPDIGGCPVPVSEILSITGIEATLMSQHPPSSSGTGWSPASAWATPSSTPRPTPDRRAAADRPDVSDRHPGRRSGSAGRGRPAAPTAPDRTTAERSPGCCCGRRTTPDWVDPGRDIVAGATVGVVALPWRWRSESVPGWARRPAWSPRWSRAWSRPYSAARTSRCPAPPARWQSSLRPSSCTTAWQRRW